MWEQKDKDFLQMLFLQVGMPMKNPFEKKDIQA